MRFDDVKPIVEGKLYAWAEHKRSKDFPAASISSIYRGKVGHTESPDRTSPQEAWAVRKQAQVYEAGIIDAALKRMSREQQQMVYLRYVERNKWEYVAECLNVELRTVYRIRDQVIAALAVALEVYENGGVA
jgi:DNA-directed RNA polymerase specialized sigma24 family protein